MSAFLEHIPEQTHTCTVRGRGDINCPFTAIVDSETQTCSRTQMGQAAHQFTDKPRFGLRFSLLFFNMKNICSTPALEKRVNELCFDMHHTVQPQGRSEGRSRLCLSCTKMEWRPEGKRKIKSVSTGNGFPKHHC